MQRSMVTQICLSAALLAPVVAIGCGEESDGSDIDVVRSDVVTNSHEANLMIPAYYSDMDPGSWTQIAHAGTGVKGATIIVNYDSGPGTTTDQTLQDNIKSVTYAGAEVIGYVPLKCQIGTTYYDRTETQVMGDVNNWKSLYKYVEGIFFDVADRPDTSWVGAYEYYANNAEQIFMNSGPNGNGNPVYPGEVVFNPGENGAQYQEYLDCTAQLSVVNGNESASRWVLFEGSETGTVDYYDDPNLIANYQNNPGYTWVFNYDPIHIVNLVYSVTPGGSTVGSLFSQSESFNAGNIYLTDVGLPNPWQTVSSEGAPPPSVWSNELSQINQIRQNGTNNYLGVSPDVLTAQCPMFLPPTVSPAMCPS